MRELKVLTVPGTWAWRGDEHDSRTHWWHPASPYMSYLATQDVMHVCPEEPFIWTTSLNGAVFWRSSHLDWQAGGAALFYYLCNPSAPGPQNEVVWGDRNLIVHSHGLQPVLYACAYRGLQVRSLISVCSPVRGDMAPIAKAARRNIHRWLHVFSDWSDKTQWAGSWFDRRMGVSRNHPLADWNVRVPSVGHSRLLHDPTCFALWRERGWLDYVREAV